METKKTEKKEIVVRDFYSVYSREEVRLGRGTGPCPTANGSMNED